MRRTYLLNSPPKSDWISPSFLLPWTRLQKRDWPSPLRGRGNGHHPSQSLFWRSSGWSGQSQTLSIRHVCRTHPPASILRFKICAPRRNWPVSPTLDCSRVIPMMSSSQKRPQIIRSQIVKTFLIPTWYELIQLESFLPTFQFFYLLDFLDILWYSNTRIYYW